MSNHEPVYFGVRYFDSINPTTSTVGRVGEKFFNTTSKEMFHCYEIVGAEYRWKGSQGTNISTDAITSPSHPDLASFYRMDSGDISGSALSDASPNNEDGTITGASVVSGVINDALSFDGNDEVVCTDHGNFGTADFSSTGWFKTTDATKNKTIINKRSSPSFEGWFVAIKTGGQVGAWIGPDNQVASEAQTTGTYNDGDWHFYYAEWDRDGNVTIKIDDSESVSVDISTTQNTVNGVAKVTMGNKSPETPAGTSITWMIGDLDLIRMWKRKLTEQEQADLYNGGAGA